MRDNARRFSLAGVTGALVLLLAMGMFGFVQQAQAADYAAGSLSTQGSSSSQVVNGTIKSGTKVTKTFTMPSSGFVMFDVNLPKGFGTTDVKIDCNDVRYYSANVFNGVDGSCATGRYTFKPGAKIKVTLSFNALWTQTVPFKITMKKETPARYEFEPNNRKAKASKLKVGKRYSGNLIKNDTDWFVFKASESGTYRFKGKPVLLNDTSTSDMVMTAYNGSNIAGIQYLTSGSGYKTLTTLTLEKGKKVYVKVTHGLLPGSDSSNYAVKVTKVK